MVFSGVRDKAFLEQMLRSLGRKREPDCLIKHHNGSYTHVDEKHPSKTVQMAVEKGIRLHMSVSSGLNL